MTPCSAPGSCSGDLVALRLSDDIGHVDHLHTKLGAWARTAPAQFALQHGPVSG